jgi:hypothetical protein
VIGMLSLISNFCKKAASNPALSYWPKISSREASNILTCESSFGTNSMTRFRHIDAEYAAKDTETCGFVGA